VADQVDYFGLYDCFPICLLRAIEAVGLAPEGQAGAYVQQHYNRLRHLFPGSSSSSSSPASSSGDRRHGHNSHGGSSNSSSSSTGLPSAGQSHPDSQSVQGSHSSQSIQGSHSSQRGQGSHSSQQGQGSHSLQQGGSTGMSSCLLPINTHGGLLAQGAPWEAPAMYSLVEAVEQLAGRAHGRQVPEARTALVYGNGGIFSASAVAVLRVAPEPTQLLSRGPDTPSSKL